MGILVTVMGMKYCEKRTKMKFAQQINTYCRKECDCEIIISITFPIPSGKKIN